MFYEAANVLLSRITRFSKLKRWRMDVAKRRGSKRAKVALRLFGYRWLPQTTFAVGCSGGLLPPSPPAEKTTARQDEAGEISTDDRSGTVATGFTRIAPAR
jgi:hypothetical protein